MPEPDGLPISINPRAEAYKGLAALRVSLRGNSNRIVTIGVQIVDLEGSRSTKAIDEVRELRAELLVRKQSDSSIRSTIAAKEAVIYGDLAPKSPPTPERMQEIQEARK